MVFLGGSTHPVYRAIMYDGCSCSVSGTTYTVRNDQMLNYCVSVTIKTNKLKGISEAMDKVKNSLLHKMTLFII